MVSTANRDTAMRRRPFGGSVALVAAMSGLLVSCGDNDPLLFPSTAEVRVLGVADFRGPAGRPLEPVPEIRGVDERGNPTPGVEVRFSVLEGGGSVSPEMMRTDAEGFVSPDVWVLGETAGVNVLAIDVEGVGRRLVTAMGVGPFFIELVFLEDFAPRHRQAVQDAAVRWESTMLSGLSPVPVNEDAGECFGRGPALNQIVDDMLIFVTAEALGSGTLAQAGPCWVRSDDGLPLAGLVILNEDELDFMEERDLLDPVILHEMGHVLGLGTLWDHPAFDRLREPSAPDNEDADTHFDGAEAIAAFDEAGGAGYPGAKVPVENDVERFGQGSLDSHWRISVFENELMVGSLSPNASSHPLSAITLASLADMGYDVDLSAADAFDLAPALRRPAARVPVILRDDVYRGPIRTMDPEGRVREPRRRR